MYQNYKQIKRSIYRLQTYAKNGKLCRLYSYIPTANQMIRVRKNQKQIS